MKIRYLVIACLAILFVTQTAYYYSQLPETVATHFDGSGVPNGWMQRQSFIIFEAVILVVVLFEFFALPRLIEKMPDSLINIPNKMFWLAPEKRVETFGILRSHFEWFGAVAFALFIAVNQLLYRANIDQRNLDSKIWFLVFGFLIFALVWVTKLIFRFRTTS